MSTVTMQNITRRVAVGAIPSWALLANKTSNVKLKPPSEGTINVAVLLSNGATIIDFCGPWEVFQDVAVPNMNDPNHRMPFRLYTVAKDREIIRCSGGLQVLPDFTFADAPQPHVVVIPAQSGSGEPMYEWLRKVHTKNDLTMSVCTGAFHLASAGLLKDLTATTHHDFYDRFEKRFPDVKLQRGLRFVENGNLASAGGLTSGIDLALRVVERYFGRDVAQQTAEYMEYQGKGWMVG